MENIWSGHIHYIRRGFYYAQLVRFYTTFSPNQIKVYLYDDLQKDPIGLLQDIFRFLNVAETFVPDVSKKLNSSAFKVKINASSDFALTGKFPVTLLKSFLPEKIKQKIITYIPFRKNFVKPTLPKEIRKKMIKIYREDILKLQDLIQRDLSKWLEV